MKAGTPAAFAADALVLHAIADLGPAGKLRVAAGWSLLAYARHPELRRAHFADRLFWKHTHRWFVAALLSLLARGLPWPVRVWLAVPWLRSLHARGKLEGGGPALAPFYAACDVAETTAAVRSAVRYRVPMA